ncbi:MAG: hypothetical protein Q4G02_01535 [bacterium]|nr:hypothetical protein [bacterium]
MKKFCLTIALIACFFCRPTAVAAQTAWTGACVGTGSRSEDVATIQGITCAIANILNVVMTIFSFVGFGMFVYGSLMWLFAGGQSSRVEKARNTFVYAIFGLILAVGSFIIIQIIAYFTGMKSFMYIQFFGDTISSTSIQNVNS